MDKNKEYTVIITYEISVTARNEELAEEEAFTRIGHTAPIVEVEEE